MGKLRKDKKRKYFRYAAVAFAIVFFVSGVLLFVNCFEKQQNASLAYDDEEIPIEFDGREYVLKENVESFLVMGLDQTDETISADSYNSNQRADFLMLLVFDNDAKKSSAIQINRDTMADVNILDLGGNPINSVNKQIALAFTYGNSQGVRSRNTMDAVSCLLLDSKINHYISLEMDAVPLINDLLGGVEVEVLHDFAGVDDTLVKGEKVTLTGKQALTYVRGRSGLSEDDNLSRMERQKQYINALYNTSVSRVKNDENFIVDFFAKLSESEKTIDSDRSITQLRDLAKKFTEYEFTGVYDIDGEAKVGDEFMEFYPDSYSVKKLVIENFYTVKSE